MAAVKAQESQESPTVTEQIAVHAFPNDHGSTPSSDRREGNIEAHPEGPSIDPYGLICLGLQHSLSSFGDRLAEFAFPLYIVELFIGTLLPASIYGFVITAFGILFSGSVAALVDSTPRLRAVRVCILWQKFSSAAVYAIFLVLFLHFKEQAAHDGKGASGAAVWALFSMVVLGGSALKLATVGINVAIERDWTMQISRGSERNLTRMNLIMRRVDLLSKLLAPLFVSLLTTAGSYVFSVCFLLGLSALSAILEFIWIEVVYLRFPVLKEAPSGQHPRSGMHSNQAASPDYTAKEIKLSRAQDWPKVFSTWLKMQCQDWKSFTSYPVFMSSVSISLLYLSVLSFDSTFISYLKNATDFGDPFISGMRGICVMTGLLGTFIVPMMQRHLGLVRAGSWSIAAELIPLIPTLVTFYVGATHHRPTWNVTVLFTGLALSRIGLWAFDVVQLTQLQMALAEHPRRNALTGLQFALQNMFDLAHYGLTIGWSSPGQFKYPAAISCGSVFLGLMVYLFGYARRLRGHVVHLDYIWNVFLRKHTRSC